MGVGISGVQGLQIGLSIGLVGMFALGHAKNTLQ